MTHRCEDGLFRPTPDAVSPLDGMGLLYDQAFVLLALAANRAAFGDEGQAAHANGLVDAIGPYTHEAGGYVEVRGAPEPLFANPNMHLFECFQAWTRAEGGGRWDQLSAGLAGFALQRLVDPARGVIAERYAADWRAPAAAADRFVWPGHLYEWAFLLLDRPNATAEEHAAALRLIEVAEARGVDARGVVIFALDDALAPLDRGARLWAQTERVRACARAAAVTGDGSLWEATLQAIGVLDAFLDVPTPGLWRDWMGADGAFVDEPAPASSLYHIVGAIAELDRQAGDASA
jgi:mannose-6-phosphate isomerase